MVAIPDFAYGAMENFGLVTYRETALLYDDHHSAAANKQRVYRCIYCWCNVVLLDIFSTEKCLICVLLVCC